MNPGQYGAVVRSVASALPDQVVATIRLALDKLGAHAR